MEKDGSQHSGRVTTLQQNYPCFMSSTHAHQGVKPHKRASCFSRLGTERTNKGIATQNVSGLHRQAGSKSVYELHGNIKTIRCNRAIPAELQTFDRRNCSAVDKTYPTQRGLVWRILAERRLGSQNETSDKATFWLSSAPQPHR